MLIFSLLYIIIYIYKNIITKANNKYIIKKIKIHKYICIILKLFSYLIYIYNNYEN